MWTREIEAQARAAIKEDLEATRKSVEAETLRIARKNARGDFSEFKAHPDCED